MIRSKLPIGVVILSIMTMLIGACSGQQSTSTPEPTVIHSLPELKYSLLASFDDVFWVDPDFYPIAQEGREQENALKQFPIISTDTLEFSAILEHICLPNKTDYTDLEKLLVYREHKKLTYGVQITSSGNIYNFILLVGEGQGERIEGTITPSGEIEVLERTPSYNTYPICLTRGTLIDTPSGLVPVEQLCKGMAVWTVDESKKRIEALVVETSMILVPTPFQVVRIALNDGRIMITSPGHPTANGRKIGDFEVGDLLDGALVVEITYIIYSGATTYDFLPSGSTGLYWANGILLKSTLAPN